jgi:hypothetical protein
LDDLDLRNLSRDQNQSLLELPRQTSLVQRHDPSLLDDHLLDHPTIIQRRLEHGCVFALRHARVNEPFSAMLRAAPWPGGFGVEIWNASGDQIGAKAVMPNPMSSDSTSTAAQNQSRASNL